VGVGAVAVGLRPRKGCPAGDRTAPFPVRCSPPGPPSPPPSPPLRGERRFVIRCARRRPSWRAGSA